MGLGIGEIVLVLALLVLFFGAKRIPRIARGVGEGIRNFRASVKEGEEESGEVSGPEDENRQLPGGQDR